MVLEVCWSGVLEREHKAPGLSSPLLPSTARMAMRYAAKPGELTIKLPPPKPKFCLKCGKRERGRSFGPFGKTCRSCRTLKLVAK